ncbi:MAG: AsmA family protein [Proteobacteria bacterium]|nr:AsmA family protein [Pseudomonadota bacterium]
MKHWKKILSGVFVLAVAGVVTGIVIIKSLDFNEYRGLIAEQVKSATGRDLTISGELNLALSLSPLVSVEGVTFANAPWGSRNEMVKLKRFAAEIELLPLLSGNVRVKRLVLVGLDLWVETDAKGRGNWELGPTELAGQGKAETKSSDPGTLPVVNWIRIEDLSLTYRDGRSGKKTTLRIANLDIRSDGIDAPMNIALTGDLNGLAVKLSGRLGSLEALMKGGAPYPVAFDLTTPGVSLTAKGAIAEPRKAQGLDLKLSVDAQDPGPLAMAAGLTLAKIPAFKMTATVSDPKGGYRLDGLKVEIGGSDLEGKVTVTLAGVARPAVSAELTSKLIDLDALLPPAPAGKASTKGKGERVFAADPLISGHQVSVVSVLSATAPLPASNTSPKRRANR